MGTSHVRAIFDAVRLAPVSIKQLLLTGAEPVFPSSFKVALAAQTSIAAAAVAAAEIDRVRGGRGQRVKVDMAHAAIECTNYFAIDGVAPNLWDKFSGLYPCADGFVRIHANFAHHRDGALAILGLKPGDNTTKKDVEAALKAWTAERYESEATQRGLVVAAYRTRAQWQAHAQYAHVANAPLIDLSRKATNGDSSLCSIARDGNAPLEGLRVLDLTRILAGPVGGRTLATYGADVMLINSPHLPNIDAIADTSRGKRSAHCDLNSEAGRNTLRELIRKAHVFIQGYRPGALAALGFSFEEIIAINPSIVMVSLSAYSCDGPWAMKRGFDSLVQTATGMNADEAAAAGSAVPKALPMQMLDNATGFLIAFAAQAALLRQREEGGAWHAKLSLARTGEWIRSLGRNRDGFAIAAPGADAFLFTEPSGFGALTGVRHSAQFSRTASANSRPSMPPGSHRALW